MEPELRLSQKEQEQRRDFEALYRRAQLPVMLAIERCVCGSDHGGNSWTTLAEAQLMAQQMKLRPGLRLLELGAGSGWPGLYFAKSSGCDVVLLDLPMAGLRIATERAANDRLGERCWAVLASAALLPFPDGSFDAISHSDLLCCLAQKRVVLSACRRAIRDGGQMAFAVISVTPGLPPNEHQRAVANGPEYIEAEADYRTILAETGWSVADAVDLTQAYAESSLRQLHSDEVHKAELAQLIGPAEVAVRQSRCRSRVAALRDGLIRRELFLAKPA